MCVCTQVSGSVVSNWPLCEFWTCVLWFFVYIYLFLNFLRHQTMDKVQKYNSFNTNWMYHIKSEVTTFLNRQLPEGWIGRGRSTSWPPQSPYLTSLDFFLLGFVEDEVYFPQVPLILNNLKDRIRTAIAKISLYCKMFGSKSNIVCCVQGNKWSTYWTCVGMKKLSELLFTFVCV
jgi:hypothetical protein